jgi:hypothetical protein
LNSASERTTSASVRWRTSSSKAVGKSLSTVAVAMISFCPSASAARCMSFLTAGVLGLVGFSSMPTTAALGTASWRTSNCFAINSPPRNVTPVALLCARRERPRGRHAEEGDELAAFHIAPLPWQLAQQLLRNAYDVVFTVIWAR